MLTKLKLWWYKGRLSSHYDVLEHLESTKCFISPFFCGESMYELRMQQRLQRIEELQCDIRKTKKIIERLEENI